MPSLPLRKNTFAENLMKRPKSWQSQKLGPFWQQELSFSAASGFSFLFISKVFISKQKLHKHQEYSTTFPQILKMPLIIIFLSCEIF